MTTRTSDGGVVADHARKTYDYLRLAMVLLVVGLAAAIAVEWWEVGRDCFQTSISAYFYTPARGVFVASLLAIGVCLVVLKSSDEVEDALLNVAGLLAPVVGLVPTAAPGTCSSSPSSAADRETIVANGMSTLLVVGLVALVATALIATADARRRGTATPRPYVLSIGAAFALWGGALAVFALDRDLFLERAHSTAAISMFLCIIGVVVQNARGLARDKTQGGEWYGQAAHANRYAIVALAMAVAVAAVIAWRVFIGLEHVVLWLEATLILLFAVFWAMQSIELWHRGERGTPDTVVDLTGSDLSRRSETGGAGEPAGVAGPGGAPVSDP